MLAVLVLPEAVSVPDGEVVPTGAFGAGVVVGFFVGCVVGGVLGAGFLGVGFFVGGWVVVTVPDEQVDGAIVSFCRVTAPFRASTRPWTVTPVFNVADVSAMIVPVKFE